MWSEKNTELHHAIQTLLNVMEKLRDKDTGCPWDIEQSMQSLTRYTIEEAYEVADAVLRNQCEDIKDELGDLLFQIVFYTQIAKEENRFSFVDVVKTITEKMVRRHPHVFTDQSRNLSNDELDEQWQAIKQAEKEDKGQSNHYLLDSVATGMPALSYAQKIQKKCSGVGFDWKDVVPVIDKVREELDEVTEELSYSKPNQNAIEDEIGDALFAMVNLARHCKVDADTAMRKASLKFKRRFNQVEDLATEQGKALSSFSVEELETMWASVKSKEA